METWEYQPAEDLEQPLIERLKRFPREPDLLIYAIRSVLALLLRAWLRVYHRFEIVGRQHLARADSFVIVANHASHLDALCLLSALPLAKLHRAFPAAASDYFFKSLPRIWVAAVVVNALPFARQVHIRQSLALCGELLNNPGNVLIIFPEGTRSTSGDLQTFRPGIGLLVGGRPTPVVPCYLEGNFRAWPKGRLLPRPSRVRLIAGPALSFAGYGNDRKAAGQVAAELQAAILQLKEQYETD